MAEKKQTAGDSAFLCELIMTAEISFIAAGDLETESHLAFICK